MDKWTTPLKTKDGRLLYGGAARNVRISKGGGMDKIIADAIGYAFAQANANAAASDSKILQFGRKKRA